MVNSKNISVGKPHLETVLKCMISPEVSESYFTSPSPEPLGSKMTVLTSPKPACLQAWGRAVGKSFRFKGF